jgi:putative ubiquitin-RnfH superfamily antitoxin RatB of RatAB toxin-antitoxin module
VTEIAVEIVFVTPDKQLLHALQVQSGATVNDVIAASNIMDVFPEQKLNELGVGIWGKAVNGDKVVAAGDRIELYRPLKIDPREARRQLALSGRTMGSADAD